MFFKMRKSHEPSEEQVNKKAMDLEEADEQLEPLAGADESHGEDGGGEGVEGLFTRLDPPQELTVDLEDEISGEEGNEAKDQLIPQAPVKTVQAEKEISGEGKDLGSLLGGTGEEEGKGQEEEGEKEDSLYDIFNDEEEEEENPLLGLIATLPDVTAQELYDEAKEVDELLREWR